ncbi:MAG: hydantoinase/oxoprolinase family protein, partial [Actinomycetota bacterium]
MQLLLGVDTGGTFTDAAAVTPEGAVVATAKTATTHHDLVQGVTTALAAVLAHPAVSAEAVVLVSLSTTLATNALVEGHGEPAGLVAVGFDAADLARMTEPDDDFVLSIAGGHDALGLEQSPLDLGSLVSTAIPDRLSAFAVVGRFSVRNPAHEEAVRDRLLALTGCPVTCSHELSARLNGPRRARTALLNARLIGVIDRLRHSVDVALTRAGVEAPVMVVKGDGSLASTAYVADRPIETILSGPAASVVGACHLVGRTDALVADVGGTTTDLALLDDGRPRIAAEGAEVAGQRTMVTAVELITHGLGGDSEIRVDHAGDGLLLGPARAVPLSRLVARHPEVLSVLDGQLAETEPAAAHGRLLVATGVAGRADDGSEATVLAALAEGPAAESSVVTSSRARLAVARLRRRGLVRIATVTPTDAALFLGHYQPPEAAADARHGAELGMALLARQRLLAGRPLADGAAGLAVTIHRLVVARTVEAVLDAGLRADGLAPPSTGTGGRPAEGVVGSPLVQAALDRRRGVTAPGITITRPVIAVGASAPTYYPEVVERLGTEVVLPAHGEVANAVGAAVGRIRITRTATIVRPRAGQFVVHVEGQPHFRELASARTHAEEVLDRQVRELATR